MLKAVDRFVGKAGGLRITKKGTLSIMLRDQKTDIKLKGAQSVQVAHIPGASELHIQKKSGEKEKVILPGNILGNDLAQFKSAVEQFGVSVKG